MYTPSFEYFIEIAKTLSFSAAAKKINVSQQNLSTYMQRLESYYGIKLLERKPSIRLTKAGRITLDAAERINEILKELSWKLDQLKQGTGSQIIVGIARTMDTETLKALNLAEYCRNYPGISLVTVNGGVEEQRENLRNGRIDILVGAYMTSLDRKNILKMEEELKEFNIIDLFDVSEYVVVSDGLLKKFFPDRFPECIEEFSEGVHIKDFAAIPSAMYPPGPVRNEIDEHCDANNVKLNIMIEAQDAYTMTHFASNGLAYCLLGITSAKQIKDRLDINGEQIRVFPIIEPDAWRKIGVFYRKQGVYPDYFNTLIDTIAANNKQNEFNGG